MDGIKQETENNNHKQSWIKCRLTAFFDIQPTTRILLFFLAVFIKLAASAISAAGFVLNNTIVMVTGTAVWIAWFSVLILIALPATDRFLQNQKRWLKPTALAIFITLLLVGLAVVPFITLVPSQPDTVNEEPSRLLTSFKRVFAYNDATALCHQATENLINGKNPYAHPNVITALDKYHGAFDKLTPLREGRLADVFPYPSPEQLEQLWLDALQNPDQIPPEVESKLCYPAGCFLLPAPFVLMGIGDLRIIYLILALIALGFIVWLAPRHFRLLLAGGILISLELWNGVASGETGLLYFPFLLLAWVLPKKNLWLSALFMGIAIITKQVAWFFLPFYFILLFQTMGIRRLLPVLGIVGGIFLASNIPFIVSDPNLWLNSLFSPMTDNLFPVGVGLITIITGGIINIQSPIIFGAIEFCVAGLAIAWYFFYCRRYPHIGPVLAVLPLFFAWRSLWPYFFYIDIMILAAIIIDEYANLPQQGKLQMELTT
jgi:hypothetical protein